MRFSSNQSVRAGPLRPDEAPGQLPQTTIPADARGEDPSIGDHALIGDCRSAALVSRDGSLDWLCWPHFSSPSIFAAVLDGGRGGRFSVRPTRPFTVERRYVGPSAVLETVFTTEHGVARLTDFMPVLEGSQAAALLQPLRELLRLIEVTQGTVELEIAFEPRPDYGRVRPHLIERGSLGWACLHEDWLLMLRADVDFDLCSSACRLESVVSLAAGDRRSLSLSFDQYDIGVLPSLGADARERLHVTLAWWQNWAGKCSYSGPHRDAVLRSALTLKLLSYAPSGAVVAAPTASLPETIGGSRNWDYRYCWLRDASFTFEAFSDLGFGAESEAYLSWLLHATRLTWPKLQVLYDVYGRPDSPERELSHLEGYRGSRPVRVGNAASGQLQLDVYGEVILAAWQHVRRGGRLDRFEARFLAGLGKTVCRRWREPDEGIWETRGARRQNTHSKLMCWVALDRLARMHEDGHVRLEIDAIERERQAIRIAIERNAYRSELDSYVAAFDNSVADASLLLMARHGFHSPTHPRMRGTYEHVRRTLGRRNGLMLRYEPASDGIDGQEGAFGICGFWAVEYLALRGDREEALARFEQLLGFANDVGLFAEEIDPASGAARGNFPQAFTHIGLVSAALALDRAAESAPAAPESAA